MMNIMTLVKTNDNVHHERTSNYIKGRITCYLINSMPHFHRTKMKKADSAL